MSVKAYATRSYVISFEVGIRAACGLLQDVLDFARSDAGGGRSVGAFAAFGDLHPPDGNPIKLVALLLNHMNCPNATATILDHLARRLACLQAAHRYTASTKSEFVQGMMD